MLEKMQKSHFVKKYSVQFVNASGKQSAPFYFWDNKPHECSQTWQVRAQRVRPDAARERAGARRNGARRRPRDGRHLRKRPLDRARAGRAVGVKLKDREVRAKVVVDASGQNGLIANRLRLRVWDPILNKGAIWTVLGRRLPRHRQATKGRRWCSRRPISRAGSGTFPQHDNIVSVGVVGPFDYLFKGRGKDFEKIYRRRSRADARGEASASKARRASPGYFATKDYSYRTTQASGDGWVLVGDAWGFLDPLYSSGVLLALKSGELAADAIVEGLKNGRHVRRAARRSGRRISTSASTGCGGWSANTTRASASAISCAHTPRCAGTVTDLLIGDLFTDRVDEVWAPMEAMYPDNKHVIPTLGRRAARSIKRPTRRTSCSCRRISDK